MTAVLQDAVRSVRSKSAILLLQGPANLMLALLGMLWLQIPDSHLWQLLIAIVIAALLIAAFLYVQVETCRRLCASEAHRSILLALLLTAGWLFLWWLLLLPIASGESHAPLHAGYWNSKLPAGMRAFFTYGRIYKWQISAFAALRWWILPGLLLPPIVEMVASGLRRVPLANACSLWLRPYYWLITALAAWVSVQVTDGLVGWRFGHGAALESASVILRLGIVFAVDLLFWVFVLHLIGSYLRHRTLPLRESGGNAIP